MSSLKKIVGVVLEILTFSLISVSPYSIFNLSIFTKTQEYYLYSYLVLCIKFEVSNFISFGNIKL